MVNSGGGLPVAFCVVVLICCLVSAAGETFSKTGSSNNCTTQRDRCCKLGRKAARHHAVTHTCHFEALMAGLDHQTSVAYRLQFSKGRVRHFKNIAKATSFRRRLAFCYTGKHKTCFESCCLAKRRRILKFRNGNFGPTSTTTPKIN